MKKFLFLIVFLHGSYSYADMYWVAFSGVNGFETSYYLMQIDEYGNIISAPMVISQRQNVCPQLTIGPRDSTTLNLWTCVVPVEQRQGNIYHLVINKNARRIIDESKTKLITSNSTDLEVTQKRNNNFLTYPTIYRFKAVRLTSTGELTSEKWTLLQRKDAHRISPDGRLLLYSSYPHLFAKRLSKAGKPVGMPQNLRASRPDDSHAQGINDVDASNILPNKTRIVVYSVPRASESDDYPDHLYSRVIDAAQLQPIGNRVLLRKSPYEGELTWVSIDPLGRFVLYSRGYYDGSALVYQSLDATGHKAGDHKVLARHVWITDLDLLKE
jgi:hypothetical protein